MKKTGGEGRPKTPSCDCILIKLISIQFSFFESKPAAPPAAVRAGLVTQGLPCAGRRAGGGITSNPALPHVPAPGGSRQQDRQSNLKRHSSVPGGPSGTRSRPEQRRRGGDLNKGEAITLPSPSAGQGSAGRGLATASAWIDGN